MTSYSSEYTSTSTNKRRKLTPPPNSTDQFHSEDVFSYVVRPEAVRKCWIRDVLNMPSCQKDSQSSHSRGQPEYYFLGRRAIPVRKVHILGMVVGVQEYERRILYSIDDGSSVAECEWPVIVSPPLQKPAINKKSRGKLLSKTIPPRNGDTVVAEGRIVTHRQIRLDTIALVKSPNDQAKHWLQLRTLYADDYDALEILGEWTAPPTPAPPKTGEAVILDCKTSPVGSASAVIIAAESLRTIAALAASPLKPSDSFTGPSNTPKTLSKSSASGKPKLRLTHPTRLHQEQLTENTFRMYLRWYMGHATAAYAEHIVYNRNNLTFPDTQKNSSHPPTNNSPVSRVSRGMTISHLRHVPELILLARRIVRQKEKIRTRGAPKSQSKDGKEPPERKMLRLFTLAVKQLLFSGAIVIWNEGDNIPAPALDAGPGPDGWAFDWDKATCLSPERTQASSETRARDLSVATTVTRRTKKDWREDVYSFLEELTRHPEQDDEESYTAVCPEVLASAVEKSVKSLRKRIATTTPTSKIPPSAKLDVQSITNYLKRSDDRWAYILVDDVEQTMKLLGS